MDSFLFKETRNVPFKILPILNSLQWTNRFAHSQRRAPISTENAKIIAVAAMDNRLLTSPITALIAQVVNAESKLPVVTVDADGENQPLRIHLQASDNADLLELINYKHDILDQDIITKCVDQSGDIPMLSCKQETPCTLTPHMLGRAVRRVQHRWPTIILNLPHTCASNTIAAGVNMADHVLLLTDRAHKSHQWLYQPGHQLSLLAADDRVTVLTVGGSAATEVSPDTIHLPRTGQQLDSHAIFVPTDTESLTVFYEILRRIYSD